MDSSITLDLYYDLMKAGSSSDIVKAHKAIHSAIDSGDVSDDRDIILLLTAVRSKSNERALIDLLLMVDALMLASGAGMSIGDIDPEDDALENMMTDSLVDVEDGVVIPMSNIKDRLNDTEQCDEEGGEGDNTPDDEE